jgi:predicted RNase H-like nuclease (RuvC/YqgF family)
MSYHYIIRNQWLTQVITPAEYIEYLEDELRDKKDINSDDYEQALREVDRLSEDVQWYEKEIVDLQKEIDLLERQNYELESKIDSLEEDVDNLSSLLRYKYE